MDGFAKEIVETIQSALLVLDAELRVRYANRSFYRTFRSAPETTIGRPLPDLEGRQWDIPELHRRLADLFGHGETFSGFTVECDLPEAGKRLMRLDARRLEPSRDASRLVLLVIDDIGALIGLEGASGSYRNQKAESMGALASGIAHDFNNILTGIMGYTELAMLNAANEAKVTKYLKNIYQSSERAKNLIRQILTFSRHGEKVIEPVSIAPLVKEALKLLRASLPTTISLQPMIRSHSSVLADLGQLHQVIINLCTNAVQAMPEGRGVLRVSVTDVAIGESGNHIADLAPGSYVRLSVEDTGHGIPEEIRDRIFEPYFSTKLRREGTGLGLSVVHGIVKSHGGAIFVSSEPGKGTVFDVYLPTVSVQAAAEERALPFEGIPRGTENILFVDDEPQIVQMVKTLLKRMGYHVTAHTGSIGALEAFQASPDKFDLVITDMTMPGLTGDQLAKKIRELRPDIPIVLCTGYSSQALEDNLAELGIRGLILKPITMRALSRTIRQVLDENLEERRRIRRYKITEDVVAVSAEDPSLPYKVVDISWEGLGLVYNASRKKHPREPIHEFSRIAISAAGEQRPMEPFPCTILSDMEWIDASCAWPEKRNRRSIRFGDLTESQAARLEYLIQHCATPL
ncbi:MAG: ATP-binding protein [Thermodesulfobacteriota bacterium]